MKPTREEVLKLAEKAGFFFHVLPELAPTQHTEPHQYSEECFHRFAALLQAKTDSAHVDKPLAESAVAPGECGSVPNSWRCFHCDEVFMDAEQAKNHFGASQLSDPVCQVSPERLRELEALLRSYQEEDTDLHREIHGLNAKHATALMREEEKGYARGLRDAAQTAEPVAWMLEFDSDDENAVTVDPKVVEMWRTQHDNPYDVTPLYTHPAKTEQPSLSDEREEDEYVIDRLSTILAGVSIAFKGEELPLHRHSYHDLAELAKAKMLEIDLLNHQIAELSAAQRQDSEQSRLMLADDTSPRIPQRQDSNKDAERYRKAIAYEDNAELLYCAVMNHCPDKAAIDAEFDAEAIDVGAIANGAPK